MKVKKEMNEGMDWTGTKETKTLARDSKVTKLD